MDVPIPAEADDSDCTEDEGIRSLSPHGTPSPSSPTLPDSLPESATLPEPAALPEPPPVEPVQLSASGTSAFYPMSAASNPIQPQQDG